MGEGIAVAEFTEKTSTNISCECAGIVDGGIWMQFSGPPSKHFTPNIIIPSIDIERPSSLDFEIKYYCEQIGLFSDIKLSEIPNEDELYVLFQTKTGLIYYIRRFVEPHRSKEINTIIPINIAAVLRLIGNKLELDDMDLV